MRRHPFLTDFLVQNFTPCRRSTNHDQVEVLKDLLKKQGQGDLLDGLQPILLDTCRVKLCQDASGSNSGGGDGGGGGGGGPFGGMGVLAAAALAGGEGENVLEPIPFHFNCELLRVLRDICSFETVFEEVFLRGWG